MSKETDVGDSVISGRKKRVYPFEEMLYTLEEIERKYGDDAQLSFEAQFLFVVMKYAYECGLSIESVAMLNNSDRVYINFVWPKDGDD